jgi:cell fate regulator YaaT (PSP1 superfamily)
MGRAYLIRYGLARVVGRFATDSGCFDRGQPVVIRTHRGTELGEILAEISPSADPEPESAPILRAADAGDLERARTAGLDRPAHFEACRAVFEEGDWPLEVIDAEPLLDPGRTVLHYLGPHRLDASGLVAALRVRYGIDIVMEPVGGDVPDPEPDPEPETNGCGDCGASGGCGDCGGCSVKSLIAARRRKPIGA